LGLIELKIQNNTVKNTTPLCLQRKDSVKNKLIIRTAKEKCIKSLLFIAFFNV
jgi:hypothetical protein